MFPQHLGQWLFDIVRIYFFDLRTIVVRSDAEGLAEALASLWSRRMMAFSSGVTPSRVTCGLSVRHMVWPGISLYSAVHVSYSHIQVNRWHNRHSKLQTKTVLQTSGLRSQCVAIVKQLDIANRSAKDVLSCVLLDRDCRWNKRETIIAGELKTR